MSWIICFFVLMFMCKLLRPSDIFLSVVSVKTRPGTSWDDNICLELSLVIMILTDKNKQAASVVLSICVKHSAFIMKILRNNVYWTNPCF